MSRTWPVEVVSRTRDALAPLADPVRAQGAFEYMKQVAPFLGVAADARRRALRQAWRGLMDPTSEELGAAATALMREREREYHYAAYDLLAAYPNVPDVTFLAEYGTTLLLTTPWWDTVDGLVTTMVSPLMRRLPDDELIDRWSASGDRWLVRAAIGHQRGWKADTNVPRVLALCDAHWQDREFFVAKAIGWAMRDIARFDPDSVRAFLADHDSSNRVAIREAERGLEAARRRRTSS